MPCSSKSINSSRVAFWIGSKRRQLFTSPNSVTAPKTWILRNTDLVFKRFSSFCANFAPLNDSKKKNTEFRVGVMENLPIAQLFTNFHSVFLTRSFITDATSDCLCSLPWTRHLWVTGKEWYEVHNFSRNL
jgi:hypothetical protein